MSLINQMLRDLESRRKQDTGDLAPEVTTAIPGPQNKRWLVALAVLVVLGAGLLAGIFLQQSAKTSGAVADASAPVSQAERQSVAAANPVQQLPGLKSEQATVMSEPLDQVAAVAVTAKLLSLKLYESDAMTRLMLEFSQLPEYGWEQSSAGDDQLQVRLRQAAMRTSLPVPHPRGTLLKAVELQEQQDDLLILAKAEQKLSLELFELSADQSHGPRLMVEFYPQPDPVSSEPQPVEPGVAQKEEPQTSAGGTAEARLKKKTVAKTPEQRAEALYQAALHQLQTNDLAAAENSLLQALLLQPKQLAARLQLVDLLQQSGRAEESEQLLLQGLKQEPQQPQLRKYYARRLLDKGTPQQALAILQSAPLPAIEADQEYFALLAALQRDNGQYRAAAATYRGLLNLRPQQALWWLGLAITLDQSGEQSQARDAYRQARALPGLRSDLRSYAEQRLEAL